MHRQKEAANRSAQPATKATKDNVLLAATTFPRVACGKIKIGHRYRGSDRLYTQGEEGKRLKEEEKEKIERGEKGEGYVCYASYILNERYGYKYFHL